MTKRRHDLTQDVYRELTIMVGPGVDGKASIKFGRHTERSRLNDQGDKVVTQTVADRVTLPEPMSEQEIDEWLEESERGREMLKRFGWGGDDE